MRKEHVVQCNCHAFHFMEFEWYTEDNLPHLGVEGYLAIGGDYPDTWKTRLGKAWQLIRGQHSRVADVLLNREGAVKLRNALETYLWDAGYEAAPVHACIPGCTHPQRTDIEMVTKLCTCCKGRWTACKNCGGGHCQNCDGGSVET